MSGEPLSETVEVVDETTGEVKTVTKKITPYDTYRKAIDEKVLCCKTGH